MWPDDYLQYLFNIWPYLFNSKRNPKVVIKFSQTFNNPSKYCQILLKLRQIRTHCQTRKMIRDKTSQNDRAKIELLNVKRSKTFFLNCYFSSLKCFPWRNFRFPFLSKIFKPGFNDVNKFSSSVSILCWNFDWLKAANHRSLFQHSYNMLIKKFHRLLEPIIEFK